jgi:ABC-2 type transport system permease protein
VIWLVLFGQLFRRVVELPGFEATSYIQFLTPGVVVMTSLFGALWSGMGIIQDLDEGILDRMLATPVHRGALISARVLHSALTIAVQAMIILGLGFLLGARIPGGLLGFLAILLPAVLLAAGIAALSNGLALLARREETLIAVVNFFGMPLVFLSTGFMAADVMPGWIRVFARGNPVNWAVEAARDAMLGGAWASVGVYCLLLTGFVLVASFAANRAFRVYLRTT